MYVCIAFVAFSCSKEDVKNSNVANLQKPSGVITQERATELSKTWESKNLTLFSKADDAKLENDVKYLRWSLEDLRNYLDYAEHEAKEKGYNMTGVRVYFAAYPEEGGRNTLFFAPAGYKMTSQASMLSSLFMVQGEGNVPVPPLNEGGGGNQGYPK